MRKAILLTFATLALALPAGAAAQIVPPGNSAAAQYTETLPTSRGDKNAQGPRQNVNPNEVIGSAKTKKLKEQGPEGAAVADFTAETAPSTSGGGEESSAGGGDDSAGGGEKPSSGDSAGGGKAGSGGDRAGDGNGPQRQQGSGDGDGGGDAAAQAPAGETNGTSAGGSAPSGSSAVGEVASQATGVSSGALGIWLPIVLVAVVLWAAFMVWRRHERAV